MKHDHGTMEERNIVLVVPLDVAATLNNILKYTIESRRIDDYMFCDEERTVDRWHDFIDDFGERLSRKLDDESDVVERSDGEWPS